MLIRSIIGLLILTILGLCNGDNWLMHGDFITEQEASARHLVVESTNSTTSVSTSLHVTLTTPPGHRINCVLAASLHMHGNVVLVKGGVDTPNVTLGYESRDGHQDMFFILVESHVEVPVRVEGNVAEAPRVTIVYDRLADWISTSDLGNETKVTTTDGNR